MLKKTKLIKDLKIKINNMCNLYTPPEIDAEKWLKWEEK